MIYNGRVDSLVKEKELESLLLKIDTIYDASIDWHNRCLDLLECPSFIEPIVYRAESLLNDIAKINSFLQNLEAMIDKRQHG